MKNLSILCLGLLINGALLAADEAVQDNTFFVINNTKSSMTLRIEDDYPEEVTTIKLAPGSSAMHPRRRCFILQGDLEFEEIVPFFLHGGLGFDNESKGLILSQTESIPQAARFARNFEFLGNFESVVPLYLLLSTACHSEALENLKKHNDACEEPAPEKS